MEAES
ncbi:hypothetical protein E2320_000400, partial [Naja naja]|jgi:hypothetical protein